MGHNEGRKVTRRLLTAITRTNQRYEIHLGQMNAEARAVSSQSHLQQGIDLGRVKREEVEDGEAADCSGFVTILQLCLRRGGAKLVDRFIVLSIFLLGTRTSKKPLFRTRARWRSILNLISGRIAGLFTLTSSASSLNRGAGCLPEGLLQIITSTTSAISSISTISATSATCRLSAWWWKRSGFRFRPSPTAPLQHLGSYCQFRQMYTLCLCPLIVSALPVSPRGIAVRLSLYIT